MKYIRCRTCKELKTVNCTEEQYINWLNGQLIQAAMPNISADERELLISGICGSCFDNLFKEN